MEELDKDKIVILCGDETILEQTEDRLKRIGFIGGFKRIGITGGHGFIGSHIGLGDHGKMDLAIAEHLARKESNTVHVYTPDSHIAPIFDDKLAMEQLVANFQQHRLINSDIDDLLKTDYLALHNCYEKVVKSDSEYLKDYGIFTFKELETEQSLIKNKASILPRKIRDIVIKTYETVTQSRI